MRNFVIGAILVTLLVCVLGAYGQTSSNSIVTSSTVNSSLNNLSINGTVFEDKNKNALFDADERGIPGWVIRLKTQWYRGC